MVEETVSWCSWCQDSIDFLMPLSIAVGIIPFFMLNLLERRKLIFTTIVIALLLFVNDYIVDYLQFRLNNPSLHGYFYRSTLIAVLFGTTLSIFLNFKSLRKYDWLALPVVQLIAAMIGILGSIIDYEEEGWLIRFIPESFYSDLFFLFWNSYTGLFPLNAHVSCGISPKNWLYFGVVQVLFNTFYLLLISFLANQLYQYSHQKMGIPKA